MLTRCSLLYSNRIQYFRNFPLLARTTRLYTLETSTKKQLPRNYWKDTANQRTFLEEFRSEQKFKNLLDWYSVKWQDLRKSGGIGLLKEYPSLCDALQYHYPEIKWNPLQFVRKSRNFWDSHTNQRLFFDYISEKYNIHSQEDWQRVGYSIVLKEGGTALMRRFSSFFDALQRIYPEKTWDASKARKQYPKGYFKSIEAQRKQLEKIKKIKGITHHSDWKQLSSIEFRSLDGGSAILSQYKSYFEMLQTIYPEHDWNIFKDVPSVSRNYWKSHKNQQKFMDSLGNILGIKEPKDWYQITIKELKDNGAHQLLNLHGSIGNLLRAVYPNYNWEDIEACENRIPTHYFDNLGNQRKFLDSVGLKVSVTHWSDWNFITRDQIIKYNGGSLLARYSSMFDMLQTIYPEYEWKATDRNMAPRSYWMNFDNQREFFDNFERNFNIREPKDWSSITYQNVVEEGGGRILRQYSSLFSALVNLYPERDWDVGIIRTRVPNNHWDDIENVKCFVEKLKEDLMIKHEDEWLRVSLEQVSKAGGSSILSKYKSLYDILKLVYPEKKWIKKKFQNRNKRAAQRWMFVQIRKLFPDCEVVEEYLHEELSRISGRAVEIDTFIPSLNIGFEFQGQHHYIDSPSLGSIDLYMERDAEKVSLCKQHDIILVFVPYWWDNTIQELTQYIKNSLPPGKVLQLNKNIQK